ncbi:hypothetical protein [Winogradskyella sediminis]|uniref:hypothetical protein n=1 Tax=Winogradskyella sediminis TaxID=1382466 RepID=UPI003AA962A7
MKIGNFIRPALTACIATFTLGSTAIYAQNFELDGNIMAEGDVDWSSLFTVSGDDIPVEKASLPSGYGPATFVRDFEPGKKGPDKSTFTTGSKDTLDILGGWSCTKSNNLGAKFDIINIYATAYYDAATKDTILYFGLERSGNEGDGNVGFWFNQDGTVGCEHTGGGGSTDFTGQHKNGDLLIVSAFSNGGTVSTIETYKWMNGTLVPSVSGGQCGPDGVEDGACAIVNDEPLLGYGIGTEIPWLTETKQPGNTPSNDLDVSKFFEGGVNLTKNNLEACFASYMGVTRSSTSTTSTLHDYAIGSFPFCAISTRKTCDTISLAGGDGTEGNPLIYNIDFRAWVTNDGLAPIPASETVKIVDNAGTPDDNIDDVTVTKLVSDLTGGGDWLPDVELFVTAEGSSDATQPTGSFTSSTNGPVNIVKATVTLAGNDALTATGQNTCDGLTLSPMLSVDKECTSSDLVLEYDKLVVKNAYSIEVCNEGTSPLTNISIMDDTAGYNGTVSALDFAKLCNSDSDCVGTCTPREFKQCTGTGDIAIDGSYCSKDTQCYSEVTATQGSCDVNDALTVNQCQDDVDLYKDPDVPNSGGQFGGDVCFSDSATYYPITMTGVNGTSENEVEVSATEPTSTKPVLGSASANCDLCPTPYPEPDTE